MGTLHKRAISYDLTTSKEKRSHIDGFRKAYSNLYETIDFVEKKVWQVKRILTRYNQA